MNSPQEGLDNDDAGRAYGGTVKTEKERRIYYQDIVYLVCNALDLIDGNTPGNGIVCGTADEPTTDVFDRMQSLGQEVRELRRVNAGITGDSPVNGLVGGKNAS